MKLRRVLELGVVLIVIAVLIPWLRASESPEPGNTQAEPTTGSPTASPPGRLAVDGVWLGMTEQQLLTNLGSPGKRTPSNADYEQWDYFKSQRLTLMLDASDKVVSVDGRSLTRDGKSVVSPGMPLADVEQVLGKSRDSLDTIPDHHNAGFSTGGQLVHLEHRNKKVMGRVSMMVDYSVVHPPKVKVKKKPEPKPDGIILREPPPLRQPNRNR